MGVIFTNILYLLYASVVFFVQGFIETEEKDPIEKILIRYKLSEWKRSGLQCSEQPPKIWNSLINEAKKGNHDDVISILRSIGMNAHRYNQFPVIFFMLFSFLNKFQTLGKVFYT